MIIVWLVVIVFLLFSFVIVKGAPFVVSHRQAVDKALDLINLKKGQTLIDLGSGNGAVLKAAADRGLLAVGYELNPLLVLWSRYRLRGYGSKITIKWGDFWKAKWPSADGIYIFLLPRYMTKLDKTIKRNKKNDLTVVSYSSPIPDKDYIKNEYGLFLYRY